MKTLIITQQYLTAMIVCCKYTVLKTPSNLGLMEVMEISRSDGMGTWVGSHNSLFCVRDLASKYLFPTLLVTF